MSGKASPCHREEFNLKKQRQKVSINTFSKWQVQFNCEHKTIMWLGCKKDRGGLSVDSLWCDLSRKHETSLVEMKIFSKVWIDRSINLKASNVTDHAKSEQHHDQKQFLVLCTK